MSLRPEPFCVTVFLRNSTPKEDGLGAFSRYFDSLNLTLRGKELNTREEVEEVLQGWEGKLVEPYNYAYLFIEAIIEISELNAS